MVKRDYLFKFNANLIFEDEPMQRVRIEFPGSLSYNLSASLDAPDDENPQAYALFAHCFTCTKNLRAIHNINKELTSHKIAVLRFDFTGLGESEGDFADTNFSSNVGDLVAAAEFLKKNYQGPKILIGHSLGGAAVLQAAGEIPEIKAVSTIAAPFDPAHVSRLLVSKIEEIEQKGVAEINLAGSTFKIKKQFLNDLEQRHMQKMIERLQCALLIFHGPFDNIVGIDNAASIFAVAKHPKSFISLDEADHLLMKEEDSLYVGKMVATWASKYI